MNSGHAAAGLSKPEHEAGISQRHMLSPPSLACLPPFSSAYQKQNLKKSCKGGPRLNRRRRGGPSSDTSPRGPLEGAPVLSRERGGCNPAEALFLHVFFAFVLLGSLLVCWWKRLGRSRPSGRGLRNNCSSSNSGGSNGSSTNISSSSSRRSSSSNSSSKPKMTELLLSPRGGPSAAASRSNAWAPPPLPPALRQQQHQQHQQQQQRPLPGLLRVLRWWYEVPLSCSERSAERFLLQQQQGWRVCACGWVRLAAERLLLLLSCCCFAAVLVSLSCWKGDYAAVQRFVYERFDFALRVGVGPWLLLWLLLLSYVLLLQHVQLGLQQHGVKPLLACTHWCVLLSALAAAAAAAAAVAQVSPRHFTGLRLWLQLHLPLLHAVAVPLASVGLCRVLKAAAATLPAATAAAAADDQRPEAVQGVPLLFCETPAAAAGNGSSNSNSSSSRPQTAAASGPLPVFTSVAVDTPERSSSSTRREVSLSGVRTWLVLLLFLAFWLALLLAPFHGQGAFGSPCVFSKPPLPPSSSNSSSSSSDPQTYDGQKEQLLGAAVAGGRSSGSSSSNNSSHNEEAVLRMFQSTRPRTAAASSRAFHENGAGETAAAATPTATASPLAERADAPAPPAAAAASPREAGPDAAASPARHAPVTPPAGAAAADALSEDPSSAAAAATAEPAADGLKAGSWLPPKPMLIGTRGLPTLRPENTLCAAAAIAAALAAVAAALAATAAARAAAFVGAAVTSAVQRESFRAARQAGASGFAADVRITANHVPFIFADSSFGRMTDAYRVFPAAASSPVDLFTWSEVSALNPGAWWLERDIYGTVSSLGIAVRETIAEERVATLGDLLALAVSSRSLLLPSLFCPSCSLNAFDCGDNCLRLVIEAVKKANAQDLLWWKDGLRDEVRNSLPGSRLVTEVDVDFVADPTNMTDIVSAPWMDLEATRVRSLIEKGYEVHSSSAVSPWQLSYLWCSGVSAVSTESADVLGALKGPLYSLTWPQYSSVVIALDALSVIGVGTFALWLFLRCRRASATRPL
ncbi:hypothetical protein Esti_006664 [Eimeria stiedai]